MEMKSEQSLPVSQTVAWEALNDIQILKACIPGCESLTEVTEGVFEVLVIAAVGPVKAKFKGKVSLADLQPPNSYTIHFEGNGGAAGHGKGFARVSLEIRGASETILHYAANSTVGGKIAQIGSRLVDMAAQKMATDFFLAFNSRLAELHGVRPAAVPPQKRSFRSLLLQLASWIRRCFGRDSDPV